MAVFVVGLCGILSTMLKSNSGGTIVSSGELLLVVGDGVGLVLSVLWNFTLNRRYTFKSANNVPIAMLKVACFYAVFTPLSTWLDKVLTENYLWPGMLSTVLIMSTNFVTEFLYDRFFVFGKSLDTNDLAKREQEREAAAE